MNALTAVPRWEQPLYSKLIFAAVIVAMLFAALPATNVLAAAGDEEQPWENADLDKEWKDKLRLLQAESLFFNQTRFYPADFENSDDLSRAWDLLHKHGFALKQANAIVVSHAGFDFRGRVTNEKLAYYSVKDLAMYLHMMRGLRMKISEEGYKVRRAR
ncbi:MAG TPA: hypothetical protein VK897_08300 [Anaerolineales bacterium]|nr:hypothetical protein [Anaerolineales bacterium]